MCVRFCVQNHFQFWTFSLFPILSSNSRELVWFLSIISNSYLESLVMSVHWKIYYRYVLYIFKNTHAFFCPFLSVRANIDSQLGNHPWDKRLGIPVRAFFFFLIRLIEIGRLTLNVGSGLDLGDLGKVLHLQVLLLNSFTLLFIASFAGIPTQVLLSSDVY